MKPVYFEFTIVAPNAIFANVNPVLRDIGLGRDNLSIPVGPLLGPTVTHRACSITVTEKQRARMERALGAFPSVQRARRPLLADLAARGLLIKRS